MALCEGPTCRRQIRWVRLISSGQPHPINPEPDPKGNIGLVSQPERGKLTRAAVLSRARRQNWTNPLYLSHFATCPDAEYFRQREVS